MNKFKQTKEVLLNLNSLPIYIAGHLKPDQDSVGSCLALANFLNKNGKNAYVLVEDFDKDILSWKGDYSRVVSDVKDEKFNFIALDLNEKKRLSRFVEYFDRAEYKMLEQDYPMIEFGKIPRGESKRSSSGYRERAQVAVEAFNPYELKTLGV